MARVIYELSFKGAASDALRAAFEAFEVRPGRGYTVVRAEFAGRSDLHQMLDRIQELRHELLGVTLVAEPEAADLAGWSAP